MENKRKISAKIVADSLDAEFDIMFNEGISKNGSLIDIGVELGIIKKAGSWFSYNGENIAQGRESAKEFLRDNPEIAKQLEKEIMKNGKKDDEIIDIGKTAEEEE